MKPKARRAFWVLLLGINAAVLAGGYAASVWSRHVPILAHLNDPERRTQTPGLFRADAVLGYAPVPGQRGAFLFPGGRKVDVRFDEDGFRVPERSLGTGARRPALLALGCSYTFGDAVSAEETFAELLGARR